MNTIKQHIKLNQYKPVYLLYGSETYLKKLYRDKLKKGILGDNDEMNYSYFEGKTADVLEIKDISETMPFFAERRIIVIENSNWFKSQSGFDEYLKVIPETTHIIFVETEIDKRGKLYKIVKSIGYVSEMNGMDDNNIRLFALSQFKKENKIISESALAYFIEMVGTDMYNILNESEKLICATLGKEEITVDDIRMVCIEQVSNQIFLMIDEITRKRQKKVLSMYHDLIALREKPLSILFLIVRHFNILLQVKDLSIYEKDKKVIAARVSVPPFSVGKYMEQAGNFTIEQIKSYIMYGIEVEENIKTGRLDEKIGLELMLLSLT